MTLTPKRRPIRTAMSSLAGNRRSPPLRRQRQRWLYARIVALLSPSADLAALTAADPADSREQVTHRECGEHGYASVVAPIQAVNSGAPAPPDPVRTGYRRHCDMLARWLRSDALLG